MKYLAKCGKNKPKSPAKLDLGIWTHYFTRIEMEVRWEEKEGKERGEVKVWGGAKVKGGVRQ